MFTNSGQIASATGTKRSLRQDPQNSFGFNKSIYKWYKDFLLHFILTLNTLYRGFFLDKM